MEGSNHKFSTDGSGRLNLTISIKGKVLNIREFNTKEIFTRRNLKPFVMLASSNCGKTTISVDIFKACLEEGYN